jgi:chemotaxis methyl-accepting protein methylase
MFEFATQSKYTRMPFTTVDLLNHLPFLMQHHCQFFTDNLLETGVRLRMDDLHIKELSVYASFVAEHKTEEEVLCNRLINSYSTFFRNNLTFAILEQSILRNLVESSFQQSRKEIRVWSAACAAGQEPYSLAILFHEIQEQRESKLNCRIVATDMQQDQINKALIGSYVYEDVLNVSLRRLQKYFEHNGNRYEIKDVIKDTVTFELFNLLGSDNWSPSSSIFGSFDLIFCSNLLFYYKPEFRARIIDRIKYNLNTEGLLIAGDAEKGIVEKHGFEEIFPGSCVFKRCDEYKSH